MEQTLENLDIQTLRDIIVLQSEVADAGVELSKVLQVIAQSSQNFLQCDGAAVELLENDEMVYHAATGSISQFLGFRLKAKGSLSGLSVETSEILHSEDTENDPRVDIDACRKVQARSMLVVPLLFRGKTVGVLKVLSKTPHAFNQQSKVLLNILAKTLSAALANSEEFDFRIKTAEEELLRSKELIELAMEAAEVGIFERNFKQGKSGYHGIQAKLMGFEKPDYQPTVEESLERILPEDRQRVKAHLEQAKIDGKNWQDEYRVRWPDGSIHWIMTKGKVFRDSKGQIERLAGVGIEITQQKEFAQKLEKALVARDEFLSLASHELQTPLTSLQLQLDLQRKNLKDNDQNFLTHEKLSLFNQTGERLVSRLSKLVKDMLEFAAISAGKLALKPFRTDLSLLMKDTLEKMRTQFEFAGYQMPDYQSEKILMDVDATRMEQVFINLLSNAIKYGNRKQITITLKQVGNEARLEVNDQGIGIPAGMHEKIFDRFVRAIDFNEVSGMGIGLFIAREIVTAHGGSIFAESLPQGSRFVMTLPLKEK